MYLINGFKLARDRYRNQGYGRVQGVWGEVHVRGADTVVFLNVYVCVRTCVCGYPCSCVYESVAVMNFVDFIVLEFTYFFPSKMLFLESEKLRHCKMDVFPFMILS